jgi:Bifunctional DNA primase/polymerase, N-terminal/AAA domain/HTH domain
MSAIARLVWKELTPMKKLSPARNNPIGTLLKEALEYAELGWHVIPLHSPGPDGACSCRKKSNCRSSGKHPRIRDWQTKATADPAMIRKWWKQWPDANIGIVFGPSSGIIDIETDSLEAEKGLVEIFGGQIPEGPMYKSARSPHRLFKYSEKLPDQAFVKCGPGNAIEFRIGCGGKGAQSVFPPSKHYTGITYEWNILPRESSIPELPESVLTKLKALMCKTKATPEHHSNHSVPTDSSPSIPGEGNHWLNKALNKADIHSRNDVGIWLACQLRDDGLSQTDARGYMEQYHQRVPQSEDEPYSIEEAFESLASAYSRPPRSSAHNSDPDLLKIESNVLHSNIFKQALTWAPDLSNREFPPHQSLLGDALIPCSEYVMFYGRSGLGKSFLMLQLGIAVAHGTPFLGIPTKQTKVLFLSLELASQYVDKRILSICEQKPQALGIITCDDLPGSVNLAAKAHQAMLRELIEDERAGLVIIDPLSLCYSGGETYEYLYPVLTFIKDLTARTGCSVVIVHHEPKSSKGTSHSDDLAALRGASQLGDFAGALMRLTETRGKLCISFPKIRHAIAPDNLWLKKGSDGVLIQSDAPSVCLVNDRQNEIRTVLMDGGELSARELATRLSVSTRTINTAIKNMDDVLDAKHGRSTKYRIDVPETEPDGVD